MSYINTDFSKPDADKEFIEFANELEKEKGICKPYNRHLAKDDINLDNDMDCYTLKPNKRIKKKVRYNSKIGILRKLNECSDIIAFDTETYKGKCKLICDSNGRSLLNPTFDDCMKFLTYKLKQKNTYRFFFNIEFDISAILKLLDDKQVIDDLSNGIIVDYKNKYRIKIIRKRFILIHHLTMNRNVIITDLFPFFKISLNEVSKIYIKDSKIDIIDGNLLNTSESYWLENLDNIIQYCIKDCELTKNVAQLLINTIEYLKLPLPKALVSPASISKVFFRFENYIGNLKNIPIKVIQAFYDSYHGGRFDLFKIGYIKNAYLYDINSQYPSILRRLPAFKLDSFKERKGISSIPINETFGIYHCTLKIPDGAFSTIPYRTKANTVIFPTGLITDWFTWYDLDLMRDYIENIDICYEYELSDNEYYPYQNGIDYLYKLKTKIKPYKDNFPMHYNILKIVMNGLYGCTIEINDDKNQNDDNEILKAGILFNPIHASLITSYGRWSVIKDIPNDKRNSIINAIHTDSLITEIPLDKYIEIGQDIGQWTIEAKGKGIILATGIYQVGNIVKTRGIPKIFVKDWFQLLSKYKDKYLIPFTIKHMLKLRECLISKTWTLDSVNTMTDIRRDLKINACETKRAFGMEIDRITFGYLLEHSVKSIPYRHFLGQIDVNGSLVRKITDLESYFSYYDK